jgi:hypothetical protein
MEDEFFNVGRRDYNEKILTDNKHPKKAFLPLKKGEGNREWSRKTGMTPADSPTVLGIAVGSLAVLPCMWYWYHYIYCETFCSSGNINKGDYMRGFKNEAELMNYDQKKNSEIDLKESGYDKS